MPESVTVLVTDLRPGDVFIHDGVKHYTVLEEPVWHGGEVYVWVQFVDGGTGNRVWSSKERITVKREAASAK